MHSIARQLEQNGRAIVGDFLPADLVKQVRADFETKLRERAFKQPAIGKGSAAVVDQNVRGDSIFWLPDGLATLPAQRALSTSLTELMTLLNQNLFLGLRRFEAHYAHYPPGGHYERHRDAFVGDDARVVSAVIYLNADWQPKDGGQLRLYDSGSLASQDVEPIGGTLVCFMSQDVEHEVRPSFSDRYSVAVWFRRD
jgi:SM-20-related protein